MIDGKQVVAVIPARSGSKGLRGKNTLPIAGRPLVAWTILAAVNSQIVDQVIVSSDIQEVRALATEFGAVPLDRPRDLAGDTSQASKVIRHAIEGQEDYGVVVYLQPTSPLRTSTHIDEALTLLTGTLTEAVVSVYETRLYPELMYRINGKGHLDPVVPHQEVRRQDLPATYVLNGAIYAGLVPALVRENYRFGSMNPAAYVMSETESVDIDDLSDFEKARAIMEEGRMSSDLFCSPKT